MDLLLLLRNPGRLLLGDILHDDKTLETNGLRVGSMPWPVLSDLLITDRREFVGVVLYANEQYDPIAKRLAEESDPKIARYLPAAEAARLPRYASDEANFRARSKIS